MMIEISLVLLSLNAWVQIGLVIDYFVFSKRQIQLNSAELLGLGIGCAGVALHLLGWLSISLDSRGVYVLTGLCFVPWMVSTNFRRQAQVAVSLRPKGSTIGWFLVGLGVTGVGLAVFSTSIWGSDAYTFWLAKGRAFWVDGGINPQNLFAFWPYDHPLLWPLSVSWVYWFLQASAEYWVQAISLAVYLAMGWAWIVRAKKALLWVLLLLATPFVWAQVGWNEYVGNADLLTCFFLLLATMAFLENRLRYAVVFLLFALLTKNDVFPLVIGFGVLLPIVYSKNFRVMVPAWVWLWVGVATIVVWKWHFGLSSRYTQDNITQAFASRPIIPYMTYRAHALREEFRKLYQWGLGWWVIGFSVVAFGQRLWQDKRLRFLSGVLSIQVLSWFWVYYVTPEDQASHINSSLFRLLLQIYPMTLYMTYTLVEGRVPSNGNEKNDKTLRN